MVWIDEVLSYGENGGECRVRLKPDGLYFGDKGLRPASCIEFIAQAYGFMSVCYYVFDSAPHSKPTTKAFLASIKNAVLPSPEVLSQVHAGDELTISISNVRRVGPIVSISGRVQRGDLFLSEAQLKVFTDHQR